MAIILTNAVQGYGRIRFLDVKAELYFEMIRLDQKTRHEVIEHTLLQP